jgi:hypothetical protein
LESDLTPVDGPLDPLIASTVMYLREHAIDTFSSCQGRAGGGDTHSEILPIIYFHGGENAGLWAIWLLNEANVKVWALSQVWDLNHGMPREPFWSVQLRTFLPQIP